MKLKLTRAMLLAILMAGTYEAQATRLGDLTVGTVNDGTNPVLTPDSAGMSASKYKPYVLDGTPGETKFSISQSGTFNNALFVREGELSVTGTGNTQTIITLNTPSTSTLEYYTTIGKATSLNISGNGASMVIDNATVRSNQASSMVVGGLDGNGSLSLKNGAVLNNLHVSGIGFFIGSVAKDGTNYYAAHVHKTKGYSAGQYDQLGKNTSQSIGAGTVTMDGGSQLYTGYMNLSIGQGHLKLSDSSEIYVGYEDSALKDGKIDIGKDTAKGTTEACNQHETVFGDVEGGVATIDILAGTDENGNPKENSGSKFYSANGLKIAAHDNTEVTVNVDGKGSLLLVDGTGNGASNKTYVGHKFETTWLLGYDRSWNVTGGTTSTSYINITNGGQASLMETYLGHSSGSATVEVLIDQESSMDTTNLTVEKGTTITNSGELSATGTITLNGGKLILQDEALVEATQLIIKSGATLETAEFSDDTAVMLFAMTPDEEALMEDPSTAMVNAELVLESGALVNLNNVALDLNGKALTMGDNVQVTYTGNVAAGEELVLFRNVGNAAEGTEYELTLNGQATTATVSGDNIVIAASVPEPTTATLSLLALAALAARRRRK